MDTKFSRSDWQVLLEPGEEIENFLIQRVKGQHFHISMVGDTAVKPDGDVANFRQPLIFEHDQGLNKAGDVVNQIRKHPSTGRYMVRVEQENVFETEIMVKKIWRTIKSGVDNIAQAVKKTVVHSGWIYSNPRRIGGMPIKTHYVIAGWAPQLVDQMMDVYDYVQSFDTMGLAAFIKALQNMPDRPHVPSLTRCAHRPTGTADK
ncbi:MAG: hypothetical protein AAB535_03740 [Patescibacteria group bacterium]